MSHRNARLTVHGRRLLIQRVRSGRPVAHALTTLNAPDAMACGAQRRDGCDEHSTCVRGHGDHFSPNPHWHSSNSRTQHLRSQRFAICNAAIFAVLARETGTPCTSA